MGLIFPFSWRSGIPRCSGLMTLEEFLDTLVWPNRRHRTSTGESSVLNLLTTTNKGFEWRVSLALWQPIFIYGFSVVEVRS